MDNETARQYVKVILRWWWLLVISVIIPVGISYYFVSREPDLYQARATVVVGANIFQDPDPDRREIDLSGTLAAAYAELVKKRAVLEPVIERLDLNRSPDGLARQVSTNIRANAQLLEIQVTDTNPEAAATIANAIADELVRRSPTSEENRPEQQAFIESQLAELEPKIEDLTEQINELTVSLGDMTSAAEIQETEERINALDQVKSRYQSIYAELLSVSRSESSNELSVFERATVPQRPISNNRPFVMAISGAAGLGLALGAILLMEYLDVSLRWEQSDTNTVLDLPVLAAIPQVSKKETRSPSNGLSPVAESVRAMRSRLYLMRPDDFYKTLLLTSPGTLEGKSFIVSNLAAVLASGGHRVIVVDADMRRPTQHEIFDRPNIMGLSDILSHRSFQGADAAAPIPLQETEFDNLFLLSSGRPPTDPAALLTSTRFPALLQRLEDQGDIILVDSPPILTAPDATIIATHVEGTILVLSTGFTKRTEGRQAKERLLSQQGVNLLGLTVNHVKNGNKYYYTSDHAVKKRWWRRWGKGSEDGAIPLSEAAARLGISRRQARRWCKSGRLSATRRWLLWWEVDEEDLDRVIEATVGDAEEARDPAEELFSEA
jgi:capsular exopolysaccharide synthesis family protein